MKRRFLGAVALAAAVLTSSAEAQGIKTDLAPPGGPRYQQGGGMPRAGGGAARMDFGHLATKAKMAIRRSKKCKDEGDLACAVKQLKKVLDLPFPDDEKSRRFLGPVACNRVILLKGQGRWTDAEAATRQGLERIERPGQPVTYHVMLLYSLRGEVLEHLGRSSEAKEAHARAESIEIELDAER